MPPHVSATSPKHDNPRQLTPLIASVAELLTTAGLKIPAYQRPYSWKASSAADLVSDVRRFRSAGHYRIGTVILHSHRLDGDSAFGTLDVVDGQQRYLTFALIAHALAESPHSLETALRDRLRHAVNCVRLPVRHDGKSDENLRRNLAHIARLVGQWPDAELEEFARFFLDECSVVVLKVRELESAFQMFDSQNTRGRTLYPTDLLKAYHLREFTRTKPTTAHLLEVVRRWESIDPAEINHVIAAVLFPIKQWSRHRPLPRSGFSSADIGLFKGVQEGAYGNGRFRWARLPLLAQASVERFRRDNLTLIDHGVVDQLETPFQIAQPVIDGEMFFDMVNHYIHESRAAGIRRTEWSSATSDQETPPHSDLKPLLHVLDGLPPGAGNRYTRELFDCLLVAYVDRFGWHEIGQAAQILARHAFQLRIALQRIALPSVDTHALSVHPRISTTDENLFSDISHALDPDVVLRRFAPSPDPEMVVKQRLDKLYPTANNPVPVPQVAS